MEGLVRSDIISPPLAALSHLPPSYAIRLLLALHTRPSLDREEIRPAVIAGMPKEGLNMVNQLSSKRLWPPDDLGPAVESLRSASAGEVFLAAERDGALSRGWLIGMSRSFGHVLSSVVGRGLAKLSSRLRAVRQPWWR
jgi:hypothetical protein